MTEATAYIARRGAFAQAIEACEELIRDYESHKDEDGNVTGPDFNLIEIEAVKTAILRIQCIEAREPQSVGPNSSLDLDGQDFYELCQRYRFARDVIPVAPGLPNASEAFEDIKTFIRTGKLPFESYQQGDATPNEG